MTKPTGRPRGRPRKYPEPHPAEIFGTSAPAAGTHKAGDTCPRCNAGVLQEKSGTYGAFLGCTEFPVCRFSCRTPAKMESSTGASNGRQGENEGGQAGGSISEQGQNNGEPSADPAGQAGNGEGEGEAGQGEGEGEGENNEPEEGEPEEGEQSASGIPKQTPPPPFVPNSPIEAMIAEIAKRVAAGLDVEVLNTVREAMETALANVAATAPVAAPLPAAALPAGMARIRIPRLPQGQNSDDALADRIIKRSRSGPVMLVGPAGCGKSHITEVVARKLGLRFGGISFSSGIGEGVLIGRLIPLNPPLYLSTEFVDFFENGGVFLGDEMDAADPSVTLVLNQALANGRLPVPHRVDNPYAIRHADFTMICTMNTDGRGQARNYVGRGAQDGAFLDRSIGGFIRMDYDRALELRLCLDNGGTEELAAGIWAIRERAAELGMSDRGVIISTRAVIRGAGIMREEEATAAQAIAQIIERFNPAERAALMAGAA